MSAIILSVGHFNDWQSLHMDDMKHYTMHMDLWIMGHDMGCPGSGVVGCWRLVFGVRPVWLLPSGYYLFEPAFLPGGQ